MLSKTFTLLFFLRKPKNYLMGKLPIYILAISRKASTVRKAGCGFG